MSISEKLTQIAENEPKVYDAGYVKGYTEGETKGFESGKSEGIEEGYVEGKADGITEGIEQGKQAEYNAFWENFQNSGKRFSYHFAFCGLFDSSFKYGWNDEFYNPIYPLTLGNSDIGQMVYGQQIFYYNCGITDTKVDIIVNISELKSTFVNAYSLKTIRKIKLMRDDVTFTNAFTNCSALENLTIEGVISKNGLNLQWSTKLSHDSLVSIINCLQDKSADTSGTEWVVTIGATNYAKLTTEDLANITTKGWNFK